MWDSSCYFYFTIVLLGGWGSIHEALIVYDYRLGRGTLEMSIARRTA